MSKMNEKPAFQVKQEPLEGEENNKYVKAILEITFNICIQLLPVWFMILLANLTKVKFAMLDYVGNILIFIIMSCITNIVSLREEECLGVQADIIKYISGFILCFALLFYALTLIGNSIDLGIKVFPMLLIAIVLFFIIFMSQLYQKVRRENSRK